MQIVFIYKYFWVIGVRRRAIHGDVHRCLCARRQWTRCARGFRLPVGELRGLSFRAGFGDRFAHDETALHLAVVHPSSATNTSVAVTGTAVLMFCNPTILRSASMPSVSAKSVARTSTGCASVTCTPPSARRVA